jgi:hypothetical protein
MNELLQEKLIKMRAKDERVREELAATGELFDGYAAKMETVHLENAAELERMIDENDSWLGKSLVGDDGAEAAWLVVQHAISLPEFFRKCLRLIEKAVSENEAEPYQAAYLHDRICFFENRPQRYGTSSDWNDAGAMEVWTLEDKERVNDFRAEVGLQPLESLTWQNEETGENKPKDYAGRKAAFEAWARKFGWRE